MGSNGPTSERTPSDLRKRGGFEAVMLDFYGTLARATQWLSVDVVLAEHGVELPEDVRNRFWNDGIDGIEHHEHSQSRDHYAAWRRGRILAMLAETDLHPGEHEAILEKLHHGNAARVLEPYDESAEVLATLRDRGVRLAICSNWDWDLAEAVEEVGLTDAVDVVVSSAWAGARKPHPLIFEHTLTKLGAEPATTLFVGDTWGPDVVGPRAAGMTPVYLRREGHWPDDTAPGSIDASAPELGTVIVAPDLRPLPDLV
jgi:putative hydrolase of the HAD superfamily